MHPSAVRIPRVFFASLTVAVGALVAPLSPPAVAPLAAQQRPSAGSVARLPFPVGEALEYSVHVSVGGTVGAGQMRVEGPVAEGDVMTYRLVFDMQAGRGPVRATDRTVSWLDPASFSILRFEKTERHPLSRSREAVRVDRVRGLWVDTEEHEEPAADDWKRLGSLQPLDELSFIYFLRTLPLHRDTTFQVSRHFDASRNPTTIRILGEELVETPVGIFRTRIVEMDVRDPKRYRGVGTVRFNIDTADCHVPVRIVSRMPVLGVTTLLLTGWASPPRYPGAMPCEA